MQVFLIDNIEGYIKDLKKFVYDLVLQDNEFYAHFAKFVPEISLQTILTDQEALNIIKELATSIDENGQIYLNDESNDKIGHAFLERIENNIGAKLSFLGFLEAYWDVAEGIQYFMKESEYVKTQNSGGDLRKN